MGDLTINPELFSVVSSESNTSRKALECPWFFCSAIDLLYGSLNLSVLYHLSHPLHWGAQSGCDQVALNLTASWILGNPRQIYLIWLFFAIITTKWIQIRRREWPRQKRMTQKGNEPANDPVKRKYFGILPQNSCWFPQMAFLKFYLKALKNADDHYSGSKLGSW